MRILFLSDHFPPHAPGGAERSVFDLTKTFQKKGHEVFVVTTCQEKSGEGQADYQGVKVFGIYANYHPCWRAYLSLYNPQTIGKVRALMKDFKPDVVLAQNIHYYLSYYCLKLAKSYSKGVFITIREMMPIAYGKMAAKKYAEKGNYKVSWWDNLKQAKKRYNPFRNIIIRHYLKYADKIFAISQSLKEVLRQNGIFNVEVIHNSLDVKDWEVSPEIVKNFKDEYSLQNKKVILFGGRLSDELKGGMEIIKAMEYIVKEVPQAVLLVAGKRNYAPKMLELTQSLGLENRIIFTGWLEGEQMKSAYFCSDAVAVPAIYVTTFNRFNMEAMACKKPVVGTCFGGASEIVEDNETGYKVNPHDTKLMAAKIIDLLKNPEKARQFGEVGYQRVKEKFNLEEKADEYLRWFEKVRQKT